ncbi:Plexin A3 [Eufriesea mexicana]|uniref:Plexin A3 n=1 Tax=Eufriesea mexicana TaxID=516756 RepID=A0A310SSY1_9HYME|nr:Plexin A3 [Eufriesea mexicana]
MTVTVTLSSREFTLPCQGPLDPEIAGCNEKLQTIGEDFCGLDVNTPLGGEDPMEGTPVLTFDKHLTAVAATSTGDYTVVFVGTSKGHLKKRSPRDSHDSMGEEGRFHEKRWSIAFKEGILRVVDGTDFELEGSGGFALDVVPELAVLGPFSSRCSGIVSQPIDEINDQEHRGGISENRAERRPGGMGMELEGLDLEGRRRVWRKRRFEEGSPRISGYTQNALGITRDWDDEEISSLGRSMLYG